MLPQISKLEFKNEEITKSPVTHKSLKWDFVIGDFVLNDGKLVEVEDIEYIKIWIEKVVRTRAGTLMYETYGSAHHDLIGMVIDSDFIKSEIERTIKEALLLNDAILSVSNFEFEIDGAILDIKFRASTIYGDAEVIIDVQ